MNPNQPGGYIPYHQGGFIPHNGLGGQPMPMQGNFQPAFQQNLGSLQPQQQFQGYQLQPSMQFNGNPSNSNGIQHQGLNAVFSSGQLPAHLPPQVPSQTSSGQLSNPGTGTTTTTTATTTNTNTATAPPVTTTTKNGKAVKTRAVMSSLRQINPYLLSLPITAFIGPQEFAPVPPHLQQANTAVDLSPIIQRFDYLYKQLAFLYDEAPRLGTWASSDEFHHCLAYLSTQLLQCYLSIAACYNDNDQIDSSVESVNNFVFQNDGSFFVPHLEPWWATHFIIPLDPLEITARLGPLDAKILLRLYNRLHGLDYSSSSDKVGSFEFLVRLKKSNQLGLTPGQLHEASELGQLTARYNRVRKNVQDRWQVSTKSSPEADAIAAEWLITRLPLPRPLYVGGPMIVDMPRLDILCVVRGVKKKVAKLETRVAYLQEIINGFNRVSRHFQDTIFPLPAPNNYTSIVTTCIVPNRSSNVNIESYQVLVAQFLNSVSSRWLTSLNDLTRPPDNTYGTNYLELNHCPEIGLIPLQSPPTHNHQHVANAVPYGIVDAYIRPAESPHPPMPFLLVPDS
jgi:hypothetical protein